jgi:hypothetical protein
MSELINIAIFNIICLGLAGSALNDLNNLPSDRMSNTLKKTHDSTKTAVGVLTISLIFIFIITPLAMKYNLDKLMYINIPAIMVCNLIAVATLMAGFITAAIAGEYDPIMSKLLAAFIIIIIGINGISKNM